MYDRLPKNKYHLLQDILNSRKCFDRRNNIFKISNRAISKVLGVSVSSVDQLKRALKERDLVRKVTTINSREWMLNPMYIYTGSIENKWFFSAIYFLGYHDKAVKWYYTCYELGYMISPDTGEIYDFMSPINYLNPDLIRARQNRICKLEYNVIGSSAYNNRPRNEEEKQGEDYE